MRTTTLADFIVAAGVLLLVGCGTTGGRGDSTPAISVTIPYGSLDSLKPFHPSSRHGNDFYVLLTNKSRRPVRVWQEWCSWGYYSLQFEAFGEDGTRHLLKKKRTSFYANFEDYVDLLSDGSVVWHVVLNPSEWEDLSWLSKDTVEHVKLRAIYTIPADDDTKKYGIWTGRASSGIYDFILSLPDTHETK